MTTAWLAGGSGLVGGVLLEKLLADPFFTKVISAGRRMLPVTHAKLTQVVVELAVPGGLDGLPAPDVAFSCLGTTIAKAGTREAFRAVDFGAALAFAKAARARGAKVFVHVSSLGADPRSRVFYSQVKGELEMAVAGVGFDSVCAIRPSILDGKRRESRTFEQAGLVVMRALGPLLGKYRPTPVEAVAAAMIAVAKEPEPGARVVEADVVWSMRG
jgi:uncharacterized protein YbjT (DUF2867 family)